MFEFIRANQLNIMLALCAVCAFTAMLLLFTKFLPKRRKIALIILQVASASLLGFDRAAYIYRGASDPTGAFMVRFSNFMVFFLTSAVVFGFNIYLVDLIMSKTDLKKIPMSLQIVGGGSLVAMIGVIIAHFTGFYYYFDENNIYHRGSGFLISYLLPVILPLIQFYVVRRYRKYIGDLLFTSIRLFVFVPITTAIVQIFAYGISIVNMSMVAVSVGLYIFAYLDVNEEVVHAHEIEIGNLQRESQTSKRLFDQTVGAFVTAAEKRDPSSGGHSLRVAELAKRIALADGKSEEECDKVFYAALLHDIGVMGISDTELKNVELHKEGQLRQMEKRSVVSAEILSSITEFPYLSESAKYCHEKYNGTGFPEGRKGEEIPELARIITVAGAYASLTAPKGAEPPRTFQVIREEFIKESGQWFDPHFAEIMVQLMDEERSHQKTVIADVEKELRCAEYRNTVSTGVPIKRTLTKIHFVCRSRPTPNGFSAPSIIIFSSYDQRIHTDAKTIEAYQYREYGEIWFDGHCVTTNARKADVKFTKRETSEKAHNDYEITAGRYDDHIIIRMESKLGTAEIILAVGSTSRETYIGLTGENCVLHEIKVKNTDKQLEADSIRRISNKLSYIDRLESDLPNVQVDHSRSAYTQAILLENETIIDFHTMSLPSANLIWHCPYIVLFYADDQQIGGSRYGEYALIKINGEITGDEWFAQNKINLRKSSSFPGWEVWKTKHKEGLECSVRIVKKGNKVIVTTENLGLSIETTTVLVDGNRTVYAALTGNRVALTDIRVH